MEERKPMEVTEKEAEVVEHLRKVDYGKVVVTVKNGVPCHLEIQKSIPLN